jgi:dihydropteroate synthase
VLAGMERLHDLGHPVLIATSRKRFLGSLLADATGELRPTELREDGTTATSTLAAAAGAWCIRTHSVRATLDAVKVAQRWATGSRVSGVVRG